MKIGYQGIEGSYSEEAAKKFAKQLKLENAQYVPLVNSQNIVKAFEDENIEYGVFAVKNHYAGVVLETKEALENTSKNLKCISKLELPVHHCVFKKDATIRNEDLEIIASHIQALMQTEKFRKKNLPNLEEKELEDTAIAARYLSEGKLDRSVAVICSKQAGMKFGLQLMYENVEDVKDNITDFEIYK